jgi:putative phosphoesterase
MRIVILSDVHANLPALNAALTAIDRQGYDLLVHTGDAIAIGPFPAECLDRLLTLPRTRLLMGNHDAYFAFGLPTPQPTWMDDGELHHQQWTHAQIDPSLRDVVARWPDVLTETHAQVTLSFLHYPLRAPHDFLPILPHPRVDELDNIFAPYPGDVIFYGHHHPFSDQQGRARYVNPGALGCAPTAVARFSVVDISAQQWSVTHHSVPYDDTPLYQAFETRGVPERSVLYQFFFGGRFST